MTVIYNKSKQKEKRRELRQKSTKTEIILWGILRNRQLGAKFRRQYSIGYYITDFCCPTKKVVIELDGEYHNEKEQIYYDNERQKTIEELGFKVLRFTNKEIEKELDKVIEKIKKYIK